MSTMSFYVSYNMIYKEVSIITWLQDTVQCILSINEYTYIFLLSKLKTQITILNLLKKKLNTVKVKAVL